MINKSQYAKALTSLLAFALFVTGCTKTRDARLSDSDSLAIIAISEFGTVQEGSGFEVPAKPAVRSKNLPSNKAILEKTQVSLDTDDSAIPERLRYMFEDLEVSGQENKPLKIVFGVDSKFVTAYKATSDISSLSALEKQIAVSATEVQTAIELQKTTTNAARRSLSAKIAAAGKARQEALAKRSRITLLVPLFKFDVQAKGILERTKNELREETSTLNLRETEFSEATHVRLALTSDARKDVGSAEQQAELDQLFTSESLDNQVTTAQELQERLNINMKFIPDQAKVLTKLDAQDMKVYEVIDVNALTEDERRRFSTGNANGEIIACKDQAGIENKDKNCVLRLAATVPVTYKKATLNLADKKSNTSNTILFEKVTKAQSTGLVEIAKETAAIRARPSGLFDPLNTIKVSDLKGSFYFRRTFESASNMMSASWAGMSGDMSVVSFELEKDRLVVRNQKALVAYLGQGPKDREELMSLPVKYFKVEAKDADGAPLQVARLIEAKKEDAEYLEVDLTKSTIPIANSPLAFFDTGACIKAASSQTVAGMDMRLEKDGVLHFSIEGSYTMEPGCHTSSTSGEQFNFNLSERVSFRKVTNREDFEQFAPNWSPAFQNSLNFNIFTLTETNAGKDARPGREGSQSFKPTIHDFRNGKTLTYWVGGLTKEMSEERRNLIIQVSKEVVAEWNVIFRKAFEGTENARSGDYIVLKIEDDSNRGRLGDLDRNYLWFMDLPTENGLLGVAQSAPHPYSGKNIANNVIVYSGNVERSVTNMLDAQKEARRYEKLLEEAKASAVAELKKEMEAEQAAAAKGSAPAVGPGAIDKAMATGKQYSSALKRLLQSARPERARHMTSKKAMARAAAIRTHHPHLETMRNEVSDIQIDSQKSFTRRVLQQAFASEFRDDPVMMEAIIAREMARTEPNLSAEIRGLLKQQAQMKAATAQFETAAKKRGVCFLRERGEYNDRFLSLDFKTALKIELAWTLSHEVGHALGLNHNFKASYDKENFLFPGEDGHRNYSSVMDYLAAPEVSYEGPGPYDLHALRAIYTRRIEISKAAQEKISGGMLANSDQKLQVKNGLVNIDQLPKFMGFRYVSDMMKKNVRDKGLIKEYAQCWDYQVGQVNACSRYDNGTSATEIVKNEIQDYHRLYNRSYVASDRLKFNWTNKVAVIRQSLETFSKIRGILDDLFQMLIYETYSSEAELADYVNAAQLGYNFFHELIRTPNTESRHGESAEEIGARLFPVAYKYQLQTLDANGKPQTQEKQDIRVIEARPLYDQSDTPDRFDTLGISYDKAFALEFLLTANPVSRTDDSQTGWISYNEFEQYFKNVESADQSPNMITMLEVMANQLQAGIMSPNNELVSLENPVPVSRMMTDNAVLGVIANTNSFRMPGLDTYAEFFKVGTLKGGKKLSDRVTAPRFGQKSTSETGVKFFAVDNASGASALVVAAARRSVLLENKEMLSEKMKALLVADAKLSAKMNELLNSDTYKGKKPAEIIKTDAAAIQLNGESEKLSADLVATLNSLNVGQVLVTAAEIKENPNMAFDKQVQLLRSLMSVTNTSLTRLTEGLAKVEVEELQPLLQELARIKQRNIELSNIPLLGLGQEILVELVQNQTTPGKGGTQFSMARLITLIVVPKALTTPHANMMYVIEDLARYTKIFNPEYEY